MIDIKKREMFEHCLQDALERLKAALQAERQRGGYLEEEARRYCCNSDYWRERAEKAEAELARREMLSRVTMDELGEMRDRANKAEAENKRLESEWSKAAQLNDDQAARIAALEAENKALREDAQKS
jgi:hypothetical protein